MHVLVTGSSGQLGREVVRQLHQAGHRTAGMDVVPGPGTDVLASVAAAAAVRELVARGVDAVVHTAGLHAPHVGVRPDEEFVGVNVSGTLNLLTAAARSGTVRRFVHTSSTSVYGHALVPRGKAVWVTEALTPRPRDIYDITKLAAEELCQLVARERGLPTICLRTGRFFDEPPAVMAAHRLYRGADVRDVAAAHLLALSNEAIDFDVFNVAARSPFAESDVEELLRDAPAAIARRVPDAPRLFARRGWPLPRSIDRVYDIRRAEERLGYRPRWNFGELMLGR